jgi:hypothetical protein
MPTIAQVSPEARMCSSRCGFPTSVCALKVRCFPGQLARKILRDVHEDARDVARRLMQTKAFLKSREERKRVECYSACNFDPLSRGIGVQK